VPSWSLQQLARPAFQNWSQRRVSCLDEFMGRRRRLPARAYSFAATLPLNIMTNRTTHKGPAWASP
jgi:hypothetical protein